MGQARTMMLFYLALSRWTHGSAEVRIRVYTLRTEDSAARPGAHSYLGTSLALPLYHPDSYH
jgi:hypothetical protein